jgi:hypothetical protein
MAGIAGPLSFLGAGANAGAGAAGGASMAALGPWMLGATALQGGFQAIGGAMEQQAAEKAMEEARRTKIVDVGIAGWLGERDKANQMAALREGNYFMQSPTFQFNKEQDFSQGFMTAGKFSPYLTGLAARLS